MLISEDYRQTQQKLHESPQYGIASVAYAPIVLKAIERYAPKTLLDYGAGKQRLRDAVAGLVAYHAYEPADPDCWHDPQPADLVACIDVLEHVEPDCLDAVLDDLKRCTERVGVFTVHSEPAMKTLPDGRNAHLTQHGMGWWVPKFDERFDIQMVQRMRYGFWILVEPK